MTEDEFEHAKEEVFQCVLGEMPLSDLYDIFRLRWEHRDFDQLIEALQRAGRIEVRGGWVYPV